jgi:hypothetical protein
MPLSQAAQGLIPENLLLTMFMQSEHGTFYVVKLETFSLTSSMLLLTVQQN